MNDTYEKNISETGLEPLNHILEGGVQRGLTAIYCSKEIPMGPEETDNLCGYQYTKRDEMTFGYLASKVPLDLVPDPSGSAQFYTEKEVAVKMTQLDKYFVGMRRSTIDETELVRQIILYGLIAKVDSEGLFRLAVYQRAAGAEAKLKDGYSFGFGGHVETIDLQDITDTYTDQPLPEKDVISSFYSTLSNGERELNEEVILTKYKGLKYHDLEIETVGFLSDVKPDQPGWIGNTHFCVIGLSVVPSYVEFEVAESKYTTIGWLSSEEILNLSDKFEPWSKILIDHLSTIETLTRKKV